MSGKEEFTLLSDKYERVYIPSYSDVFISKSDIHGMGVFAGKYLFSWDKIPGNDNGRLIDFLKQNYCIDWIETAKVEKIDGKIIRVFTGKNCLSLKLNDEKTEVSLTIDDGRTSKFDMDGFGKKLDELNIYSKIRLTSGQRIAYFEGNEEKSRTRYSLILDGKIIEPTGKLQNLNHSCDPNAHFCNRWLFANREIPAGEEITIDYLATEKIISHPFECECGAGKRCRKRMGTRYLFSWDEISGNDNGRLIDFLQDYGVEWVKTAKIEKIDDDKTIRVSTEKNCLSLRLNDKKTEVSLKIDDVRTDEFIVLAENDKLKVYYTKHIVGSLSDYT